ncbi:ribosome silencing factor [Roseomonas frigidaquae]|uniref:Ribosomal silencing factor RsfS n=2 Tax=Falsiroseomonas frigidaquae TaxID=487318 RepID=A0ABX1EYJ5_9PROT|nr:ribosome silencing factor [Falsiroseomonas frigidaquae]NKE45168.1 ribosome silencing factor [Falsiroseomonas frigidaquae]
MPAEAAQPAKLRAPRKAKAEQPAAPDTDSGTEAGTESGADSLPEAEPAPPAKRRATRKPKANAVAPAEGEDEAAAPSAEEAAAPATAPRPRRAERQKVEPALLDRLVAAAQESLDADKAEDIVVLDVTGRADYADCLVIATALADRQMQAMASHLEDAFEKEGLKLRRDATQASPDWVLIDAGDLVVHLFKPEARTLYGLERMWGPDSPAATVDEEEDRTPLPDDGSVPEPGIEEDDDE